MAIKAEILIRDENGRLFKGTVDLHLQEAVGKKKIAVSIDAKKIKESRSKVILRLREFKSQGFFNSSNKRTMSEIKVKLRAKGVVLKPEQIQPYLTQMVVNDELERDQITRDRKKSFVYFKI